MNKESNNDYTIVKIKRKRDEESPDVLGTDNSLVYRLVTQYPSSCRATTEERAQEAAQIRTQCPRTP